MSATWDSKGVKATPISADEILLIDTGDSRNQKRATLGSFGAGLLTLTDTTISPTTLTNTVGIGTATTNASAKLEILSTTQGFLPPRMTETQRDAISSPADSLLLSNTTKRTYDCFTTPDWRSFATQGTTTTEAWAIADFPAAVSNVITLSDGLNIIKKTISTADRFDFGTSQKILFDGEDRLNLSLTYTGIVTLFTAATNTAWETDKLAVIASGNNAQLFDITKGNITLRSSIFTMSGTTPTIGTISETIEVFLRDVRFTGFQTGLSTINGTGIVIEDSIFRSNQLGSGAALNITKQMTSVVVVDTSAFLLSANESAFFIDPQIIGTVAIRDCNVPTAQFFKTAPTGTFTAASDEAATNAISSVSDNGGIAVFDKGSALTNILDDDIVVHTTFSEGTYNGTFEIFATTTDTYQVRDAVTKVAVSFVATGTGTGTTELTRFTSTAHGLSAGDMIVVNSSLYDDKGSEIRGTPLTNSFDLKIAFNGTDTGMWSADLFEFSAASDQSVANTITSVESTPGGIRFVASGGISGLAFRDVVTHTGFTVEPYNGVFIVSNVLANSYDVVIQAIPFSVTDTGTSDSNLTRFDTINHGLIAEQGVQVKSLLYFEGGGIKAVATSTIDLRVVFQGTDTGSLNINSLDHANPKVTVSDSTGSPDSVVEGEFSFVNLATPETVAIVTEGVPVAIAGGAWTASSLERIREATGGNGIAVYNGIEDIDIPIGFFCLLEKVGGGATEISCTILVNGVDVLANHPHSVNAGVIQISGEAILSLKTGDTIQMAVINDSGTADIDVSQANMVLSLS